MPATKYFCFSAMFFLVSCAPPLDASLPKISGSAKFNSNELEVSWKGIPKGVCADGGINSSIAVPRIEAENLRYESNKTEDVGAALFGVAGEEKMRILPGDLHHTVRIPEHSSYSVFNHSGEFIRAVKKGERARFAVNLTIYPCRYENSLKAGYANQKRVVSINVVGRGTFN